MKQIIKLICLSLVCLGIAWVEYQMVLHFRSPVILIALAGVFGALSVALFRAPEGYERPDGFHVRRRDRRFSLIRHVRSFQPARAKEWR
jgi:hypothetical protein